MGSVRPVDRERVPAVTPIEHIVTCRSGCVIDDLRFCPDVPAEWAEQYRARAEENPDAHESFVRRVIFWRITGHDR